MVEQVDAMNDDILIDNEDMIGKVRKKFERLSEVLDEHNRRMRAAVEAEAKPLDTVGTAK